MNRLAAVAVTVFFGVGVSISAPGVAHAQTARTLTPAPAPAPTRAQQGTHVWYGITVGGAGMRLTCDLCQAARDVGPAFTIAAGVYAKPQMRVGLEVGRWTYEENGVREHMHSAGLVAHITPNPRRGLYLLGGFGWSGYRADEFTYNAPRVTVGVGWDIPAFGEWIVGNVVALDAAAFAPLKSNEVTVVRDVGMSSVRVAVQLRRR